MNSDDEFQEPGDRASRRLKVLQKRSSSSSVSKRPKTSGSFSHDPTLCALHARLPGTSPKLAKLASIKTPAAAAAASSTAPINNASLVPQHIGSFHIACNTSGDIRLQTSRPASDDLSCYVMPAAVEPVVFSNKTTATLAGQALGGMQGMAAAQTTETGVIAHTEAACADQMVPGAAVTIAEAASSDHHHNSMRLNISTPPGVAEVISAPNMLQPTVCPVCGCLLADISHSDTGQSAHVNACLDLAAAVQKAAVSTSIAQPTAAHVPANILARQAAEASTAGVGRSLNAMPRICLLNELDHVAEQQEGSCSLAQQEGGIAQWLRSIGAAEVLEQFLQAELDMAVLPYLTDYDLEEMGIPQQLRRQILSAAATTAAAATVDEWAAGEASEMQRQMLQQQEGALLADDEVLDQLWHQQQEVFAYDEAERINSPEHLQSQGAELGLDMPSDEQADHNQQQQWPAEACQSLEHHLFSWQGVQQQQQQQRWLCSEKPTRQQHQQQMPPIGNATEAEQSSSDPGCPLLRTLHEQHYPQQQQQEHIETASLHGKENRTPRLSLNQAKQWWQSIFDKSTRNSTTAAAMQQQQQRPRHKQQQSNRTAVLADLAQRSAPLPSWWPAWRRLPGSNIVVDAFGSSSKALGCNRSWILTHFHADHYGGLSRSFKQGIIICTPVTAALVRLKLKVAPELLLPLPLGQEVEVEGTRIQLVDANHCPGAAMVLAHPPAGAPPVLHTGDARLTVEATQQQPALQAIVGKAVLVLDTTYADPAYCFPSQQQVLDWCLQAVKAEAFNPRCLFLFGSYTIGKERLFMHVAAALGLKVYVCATKRSIMSCLDLPPEQQALLTTNHLEANIHVVPMRQVTLDAMEGLLQRYRGRYTAVVGFQPTGWTHGRAGRGGQAEHGSVKQATRSSSSVRPSKRLQRGTVVLYQVPYSEHSSCAELQQFVQWFKPIDIIPSVSNDGGSKLQAMLAAVTAPARPAAVQGPMDMFARPMQQQRQRSKVVGGMR